MEPAEGEVPGAAVTAATERISSSGVSAQTSRMRPVCAAQYWRVCWSKTVQPWWSSAASLLPGLRDARLLPDLVSVQVAWCA
ncbi:hypothetical protein [Nocardiopsis dassonvillei]|uniref:hypothetical protein n=1 Tax=Nocardiopsis dassonvillei TaxID=2014 RepID=UPI00059F4ACC|nr:hypothetical protein [Nocardiopsis dassonvillei]APC35160.1 hypothetical protein A9R04_10875 [Nocardiopsis dassonvillei]NKY81501.1 hypothetical protein [Nocardiopsis dassonvillei]